MSEAGSGIRKWPVEVFFWLLSVALFIFARGQDGIDNGLIALIIISLAGFIATVFHELGHAFAAYKAGAQVLTIAALPFRYSVQSRKLRFEQYWPAGDIGGYVEYTYKGSAGSTEAPPRKRIWIAAAGPLANFATAALAILAVAGTALATNAGQTAEADTSPLIVVEESSEQSAELAPAPPPSRYPADEELSAFIAEFEERKRNKQTHAVAPALVNIFIAYSIIIGLLNLVPYRGSDGSIILDSWRRLKSA